MKLDKTDKRVLTGAAIAIIIIFVFFTINEFINMAIHGQEVNTTQNSSSQVDKLIQDVKQEQKYRAEIINRIENSTCVGPGQGPYVLYKEQDPSLPTWEEYKNQSTTHELEEQLKWCVKAGWIK